MRIGSSRKPSKGIGGLLSYRMVHEVSQPARFYGVLMQERLKL